MGVALLVFVLMQLQHHNNEEKVETFELIKTCKCPLCSRKETIEKKGVQKTIKKERKKERIITMLKTEIKGN